MRVLFVDDEPNVLDSIRRQLRKSCEILTATSGAEALALLKDTGPVALVISDMRMPGMSGAELLAKIRDLYPDTVRMILSGQADLDSTIAAAKLFSLPMSSALTSQSSSTPSAAIAAWKWPWAATPMATHPVDLMHSRRK